MVSLQQIRDVLFFVANCFAQVKEFYPRLQPIGWITLTAGLFLGSNYCSAKCSTDVVVAVFTLTLILGSLGVLAPSTPWDLKYLLGRNYVFALMKAAGVMISFNIFEKLGDYLKSNEVTDWNLVLACGTGFLYVVVLDQLYGLEDDFAITDGLIYALYGTFMTKYAAAEGYLMLEIQGTVFVLIFLKYLHPEAVKDEDTTLDSPKELACRAPCCLRRIRRSQNFNP